MKSLHDVAAQYRGLRFNNIADALESLISSAEANELTHLQFAAQLVEHELTSRETKRVDQNMRRAGFPIGVP